MKKYTADKATFELLASKLDELCVKGFAFLTGSAVVEGVDYNDVDVYLIYSEDVDLVESCVLIGEDENDNYDGSRTNIKISCSEYATPINLIHGYFTPDWLMATRMIRRQRTASREDRISIFSTIREWYLLECPREKLMRLLRAYAECRRRSLGMSPGLPF